MAIPAPSAARARRRRWLLAPLSAALLAPGAHGAAFLPGAEADPATGALSSPTPAEPLLGPGIVWQLAPWRHEGTLSLDGRWLRLEDGVRTQQTLLMGDVDFASYIWQPWFVQLRAGLGLMASSAGGEGTTSHGLSLTGRTAVSIFPASRFPFELRADVGDSRSSELSLGSDYRTRRVSLTQSWRPASGSDLVQLQMDHSRIDDSRSRDTLNTVGLSATRQVGPHTLELGLNRSANSRSGEETEGGETTRISALTARHGFHPSSELDVETLASWNELRLSAAASALGSDVRQVSSFASWRPRDSFRLGHHGTPLFAATARWAQARSLGAGGQPPLQAVNVSLGVSQDLTPTWRAALSANASRLQGGGSATSGDSVGSQAALSWADSRLLAGGWRYAPSAALSLGNTHHSRQAARTLGGLQFSHGASRDLPLGEGSNLSFSLTQSVAALHESGGDAPAAAWARSLAHGASIFWQGLDPNGSQGYGGLSVSDSRSLGATRGSFQLVNLQFSRRMAISRYSNWSANLTLQATRNQSSDIDVFTGERREQGSGWQRFYNGTLSYENQRAFGVPRLRHSVLLGLNSQPLERRAFGDIDAPRERITASLESRLDYAIGRLDTRLSARVAKVDSRVIAVVQARAQRHF